MLRDISLHIMDLCENSIKAQASRIDILIKVDFDKDELIVSITDNGVGMDSEMLSKVVDPFTTGRTTRNVGLGIPFFKQACEMTGGHVEIVSRRKEGTTIKGKMVVSHIDRLPLGDIGETFQTLIMSKPEIDYVLRLENLMGSAAISTMEIKKELEDVPITTYEVLIWLKTFVNTKVSEILGDI
ncbi:MAG TPA: ATP-binding protein [Clostridiaceae bacterium]|jgi:anti-sigma regulatory factor (Ser/Thr protein kinase)|nr:ATP-binding protein [Clostridiaceae bacterium]